MPQINHFFVLDKALAQEYLAIFIVAVLFVVWNVPPQRCAASHPDCRTIKLVQQQIVLGGATVIRSQHSVTHARYILFKINQKNMYLAAQTAGPLLQGITLAAQVIERKLIQTRHMAQPEIHITLGAVAN